MNGAWWQESLHPESLHPQRKRLGRENYFADGNSKNRKTYAPSPSNFVNSTLVLQKPVTISLKTFCWEFYDRKHKTEVVRFLMFAINLEKHCKY